ncbi:MAG: helix-turn-helix transcriptional regulator [Candidatus Heimdallarchaeaceae archaeon]
MEEWKEFTRWKADDKPESTYAIVMISDKGKAKRLSYKKWNQNNDGYSIIKEYLYVPQINRGKQMKEKNVDKKYGKYIHYNIKSKSYAAHRLVASLFVPNRNNKPQVNHIDENRSNNNKNNLEWVTNQENQDKKSKEKKIILFNKTRKLNNEIVNRCLLLRLSGKTCKEIGEPLGVSYETIRTETNKIATKEDMNEIKRIQKIVSSNNRLKTRYERGQINEYHIQSIR